MFRIYDPAQHIGLWIPTRLLAFLLTLLTAFAQPLAGIAQTVAEERGAALVKADSIKEEALLRLRQEATHILAEDQQRFANAMREAILAQLRLLDARFAVASAYIGKHMDGGLSLLFTGEEAMQRLLQDKLDRAVTHAGIEAQRTRMNEALEAALADRAIREYQRYREIFDRILYDVIREEGLLGPLTDDLVREMIARVDVASRQMAIAEGLVDPQAALTLPTATLAAVSAVLTAAIARYMAKRLGIAVGARILGAKAVAALGGLPGLVAAGILALLDIHSARSNAIGATRDALWQTYRNIEQAYTGVFLRTLTEATVAGLEQLLQRDREAARLELHQFFDGILVQAQSPGFQAFRDSHTREEGLQAIRKVSAVFGREAVEAPFALKYALVSDLDAGRANTMVQQYGSGFVDLYARQPKALAQVMQSPRYPELVLGVLSAGNPDAALLFFKRCLDRFGHLDAKATDALLLVHALHPTKRPEDLAKDVLIAVGEVVDRLTALKQQAPDIAAAVVDRAVQGQMSGTLMQRLGAHAEAALLFALPLHLGTDAFIALLKIAGEDTLLRFVGDFSTRNPRSLASSPALALLREDGPGYLHAYMGAGPRAVRARQAMRQSCACDLDEETDRTLHWLLTRTGIDAQAITLTTIRNLHAVGMPGGLWPSFLALPMAVLIARTGLTLPLMLLVMMVVLPLGLIWFRVIRFSLPKLWLARVLARRRTTGKPVPPGRQGRASDAIEASYTTVPETK